MSERPSTPLLVGGITASILAISSAAILFREANAPPLPASAFRLLFATLLLVPFALWRSRSELAAFSLKDWLGLTMVGLVLAAHFGAWVASLGLTTVAASVVLVTLHPAIVAVASTWLFGEGLAPRGYVGIIIALAGGAVITLGDAQRGSAPLLGDALALVGALAAAAYFLAGRSYRRRLGLLAYVTPVYGVAALALLVGSVLVPAPYGGPLVGYDARQFVLFLLLAGVPMILGHTVLNWALKYVTAPVIATTILGEPVGASILAFFILREAPGTFTLVGGALVLIGIGVVAVAPRPQVGEAA
ncbi:MAG: DMT family transporter [Candidatus Thermoplasmatota archaeon]